MPTIILRSFFILSLLSPSIARASEATAADAPSDMDVSYVMASKHRRSHGKAMSLSPVVGGAAYLGRWNENISNSFSFGLLVEFPVSELLSIEAEGGFSRYKIAYTQVLLPARPGPGGRPVPPTYGHEFDQYLLGANAKFYLTRGPVKPYVGAGLAAVHYANMDRGPLNPNAKYSQWLGAAQAIAGLEARVTHGVYLGGRLSWVIPVVGTPQGDDRSAIARPGLEDATAMTRSYVRFGGTARIEL